MSIEHFVHRCIVQSGPMEGNKHNEPVASHEFEFGDSCSNCGELLATDHDIIAHIYEYLLNH